MHFEFHFSGSEFPMQLAGVGLRELELKPRTLEMAN